MTSEIFDAARAGDAERVATLLAADPAIAGARDDDGLSLVLLSRYRGDGPVLRAVLAAGPTLDVFDAAALGETGRLGELLAGEPFLAAAWSTDGFTALHLAAFFGHPEAVALLLASGAAVDAVSRNPMRVTALHSGAAGRDLAVCRLLIEHGADVNAEQRDAYRPLHAAAQSGDEALADLFLAAGAERAATTDDGRTPADLAAAAGRHTLAERLRA
jgi:ankyrin repeat protein